jgi:hypothetical protein
LGKMIDQEGNHQDTKVECGEVMMQISNATHNKERNVM